MFIEPQNLEWKTRKYFAFSCHFPNIFHIQVVFHKNYLFLAEVKISHVMVIFFTIYDSWNFSFRREGTAEEKKVENYEGKVWK